MLKTFSYTKKLLKTKQKEMLFVVRCESRFLKAEDFHLIIDKRTQ
jgi:hypothetical protein